MMGKALDFGDADTGYQFQASPVVRQFIFAICADLTRDIVQQAVQLRNQRYSLLTDLPLVHIRSRRGQMLDGFTL